jgi:hypothetical protein
MDANIAITILVTLAALFSCAAIIGLVDRKPFLAGFMAFTAASIVCSVAMAVQW